MGRKEEAIDSPYTTGPSLSIPGSAKLGIYGQARRIVAANHLTAALVAVVVLSAHQVSGTLSVSSIELPIPPLTA